MNRKIFQSLVLTAILVLFFFPRQGQGEVEYLKGKVHYVDKEGVNLSQKIDLAKQEFQKEGKGDVYFTGHTFLSMHEIHQGRTHEESRPYTITVRDDKIKRKRAREWKGEETSSTKKGNEVVGLVLLHKVSGKTSQIVDAELIDLDNTYEFIDESIYWLGDSKTEESIHFLEKEFESGDFTLRKTLVLVISSHDHSSAYDFLRRVSLGNYETKVRENAIFWLGSYKDERSLKDLRDIYKKVDESKLKKQIVFALQMSDQPEAIDELVRIAKTDDDQKIRKDAIFWLGQKASERCVEALKDIVDDSDEETKVKESAVFAISQLPKEKSVPMLIDIARTNKNPKVKKQAIFWLGQKDDEAALKFFEEILLKHK